MCDVVVGALSRIHLDPLRGGLDPRLVALDWSINEVVRVWGDSESAFCCSDPDLSFAFVDLWCERRLRRVLLRRSGFGGFSGVYLASLWSGVPSFPKTETLRLVSVKGYVLCSGVMMAALPCQSVHVGYCGCVVVLSPWFALAIEVWRFRICRLWLLSSLSLWYCSLLVSSSSLAGADVRGLCLPISQPFWPVSFGFAFDLPCVVVGLEFLMSDRVVSALEAVRELFLVEPDYKEQIIKIIGFCLSV
ncbi:unnamed protein product [Brassica napus]|uniref:(rape) hypothetical protein n=1 Tax=Brassica napus TaxID=3708 RepID=A0A816LTG9_BRANA|nr:unnamed protein product [Brassica napus]